MKGSNRLLVVCLCMALVGTSVGAGVLKAQTEEAPGSKRKVKSLGKPQYTDLAKRLNLSGTVKIEVTVGADGKVKRTHVLGGHPVLAAEAEKAAMESEFEPGPRETTEVIEFKFGAQ
ncbi:MAG: TonB family protein [Candidatus Acidiferrum sp.]